VTFLFLAFVLAQQDVSECTDAYSDCHDNCSLKFGITTRDVDRLKLGRCMQKCKDAESSCRDRYFETKNNALDQGAVKTDKHDDDLREDGRRKPVDDEPAPPPRKKSAEPVAEKKTEVRQEDLPKRTATRAADLDPKKQDDAPPPPPKKAEPIAEKKPEEQPQPQPKPKKKEKALDEWDPEAL
jgi:hypothetical protein